MAEQIKPESSNRKIIQKTDGATPLSNNQLQYEMKNRTTEYLTNTESSVDKKPGEEGGKSVPSTAAYKPEIKNVDKVNVDNNKTRLPEDENRPPEALSYSKQPWKETKPAYERKDGDKFGTLFGQNEVSSPLSANTSAHTQPYLQPKAISFASSGQAKHLSELMDHNQNRLENSHDSPNDLHDKVAENGKGLQRHASQTRTSSHNTRPSCNESADKGLTGRQIPDNGSPDGDFRQDGCPMKQADSDSTENDDNGSSSSEIEEKASKDDRLAEMATDDRQIPPNNLTDRTDFRYSENSSCYPGEAAGNASTTREAPDDEEGDVSGLVGTEKAGNASGGRTENEDANFDREMKRRASPHTATADHDDPSDSEIAEDAVAVRQLAGTSPHGIQTNVDHLLNRQTANKILHYVQNDVTSGADTEDNASSQDESENVPSSNRGSQGESARGETGHQAPLVGQTEDEDGEDGRTNSADRQRADLTLSTPERPNAALACCSKPGLRLAALELKGLPEANRGAPCDRTGVANDTAHENQASRNGIKRPVSRNDASGHSAPERQPRSGQRPHPASRPEAEDVLVCLPPTRAGQRGRPAVTRPAPPRCSSHGNSTLGRPTSLSENVLVAGEARQPGSAQRTGLRDFPLSGAGPSRGSTNSADGTETDAGDVSAEDVTHCEALTVDLQTESSTFDTRDLSPGHSHSETTEDQPGMFHELSFFMPGLSRYRNMPSDQVMARMMAYFRWGLGGDQPSRRVCHVCGARPVNVIFFSCQHIVVCCVCARRLHGLCPLCSEIRPFALFDPDQYRPS